jgi:hypothetical protein
MFAILFKEYGLTVSLVLCTCHVPLTIAQLWLPRKSERDRGRPMPSGVFIPAGRGAIGEC